MSGSWGENEVLWEKPTGEYFYSFFDRNTENIHKRICKTWKHLVIPYNEQQFDRSFALKTTCKDFFGEMTK